MAVRRPLYVYTETTVTPNVTDLYEYADDYLVDIRQFAGWVHAQYPSTELVTTGTAGTQLANQNFTDTYYVAGAYTTRVDRFSTEAETPNVSMVTDTYNRIRQVNPVTTEPTGDTNNSQFPVYIDENGDLRCMTRQDFIDTFVTPSIPLITNGGSGLENGGTYFLTTSTTPTNATILPTPAAVNSVAILAAYTSGGIPEATKQTTDINYYVAKVEYSDDDYLPITDALPVYFNAGDENLYAHTPESWAALLGPYLQYFISSNPQYALSYNINGAGQNQGVLYTDSRRTPSGTGYTTRFVNANDYRTQEFPTGTESTIAGSEKRLRLVVGTPSTTYAASSNPSGSVDEGSSITFTMTTTGVSDGSSLPYEITGIQAADISSGALTGNITINSNTGSTSITLDADGVTEGETITFTCAGETVNVTVNDLGFEVFPNSTLAGWGTESREIYNADATSFAQAFCSMLITNEFTTNSRVKIRTTSGDNSAFATPIEDFMEIGSNYTSPLIEFRYVWTSGGGSSGTDFDEGSYAPSTWYTLNNNGGAGSMYADASASGANDSQAVSATGVYFEVRISQAGQPTVVRSSTTRNINLFARTSALLPE